MARDVSDELRLGQELKRTNALLRSVFAAIPDLLIVVDRDFKIQLCNYRGHDQIEPGDEGRRDTCHGRFKLLAEPCEDCSARPVFETGAPSVEREMINPADQRWRAVRCFPVTDEDGQVVLAVEHVQDIDDRKRLEQARQAEDARRRREAEVVAALASSPEMARGAIDELARTLSQAAAGVLGVDRVSVWLLDGHGAACCIAAFSATPGVDERGARFGAAAWCAELELVGGARHVAVDDVQHDPRTGGQVWAHLEARRAGALILAAIRAGERRLGLLRLEQAGPRAGGWTDDEAGFVSQLADQLGIAALNREAAEARARVDLVVRATTDLIYEWDVASGKLAWSDDPGLRLGYPPGTVPASIEGLLELVHPDDRATVASSLEQARRHSEPVRRSYRVRHADGSYRWWEDRALPRADGAAPPCWTGGCADVSDRVELERQLRASQKMEAIGRLAGGLAHDFNNVLCAVLGNLGLALAELAPGHPTRLLLTEANDAAGRAADLTRQLLAFSRKQVIEPRVLDPTELLLRLRPMLERLIGEDIALATEAHAPLGQVRVDPTQLEQVLINLAINARDAMPDGGQLRIEAACRVLDGAGCAGRADAAPVAYLTIAVSDTGMGMDAATRERIFEPFFSTKTLGKGTGLGLATAFGIVRQHGGWIEVESAPGAGACFTIYLPRVEEPAVPLARPSPAPLTSLRGSETVLVVEDERAVRELAVRILGQLGYRVLSAATGGDALIVAERTATTIDLLLTDVVMPHMNGRALAQRLELQRPGLRVLYTSGYSGDLMVHHGVLAEGLRFLPKPYTPETLATQVRRVLDEPR